MKKFIFVSILLTLTIGASGYPSNNDDIPNGAVNSGNTCHLNNYFKADFAAAGNQWTLALCNQDSDSDGWTNGEELLDPNFLWSYGDPDPGDPADVTNPDDPTDYPSAVNSSSIGEVKVNFK